MAWDAIKFLESASNVRGVVHRATGRSPSAAIAREIAVCLQQGRLYFEAADSAPIEIRPVLLYYGIVALSQAVVVMRRGESLATLARSHGLLDVTPANSSIEDLAVRVEGTGTFQEFNDVIAPLGGRLGYVNSMPRWFSIPFDPVAGLNTKVIAFKDVLARVPSVQSTFVRTFGTPGCSLWVKLNHRADNPRRWELRIDDPVLYENRQELHVRVSHWRTEFPFLRRWTFKSAEQAWGQSVLLFDNKTSAIADDLSEDVVEEWGARNFSRSRSEADSEVNDMSELLPPLTGGYSASSSTYAIQPLHGTRLADPTVLFLGCFMLGALVRYRPLVWQHSVSRSFSPERPADDRALALVEEFLAVVQSRFPRMVIGSIDRDFLARR